jgi:Carboxypeptidase regulatory-like domain/TonB dependent receptor-like, beta-barrel/TonB-dependent Receptor Plug Domain
MKVGWYNREFSCVGRKSVSDSVYLRRYRLRVRQIVFLFLTCLLVIPLAIAQSPNGTISGIVVDPSGAVIVRAEIVIVNDATGVQYPTKTNGEGIYVVPNLPPGTYRLQVSKIGFKTLIKPDITLHVQDALEINFTLPIGAASETVTVRGGAPLVNTESAAVSTVVDRQFVANMPLNGRSLQDLILLTPGVVTSSPQSTANNGAHGEFSVNGQRTESNYYTVDGVDANIAVSTGSAAVPSTSGSLPSSTALGTTQALISLDALEEFRVESSTYSAEYGRNPGGQFSFASRSGTNEWHGTAFDYLRNNIFDANDWFNDYFGKPAAPLRQNDFGGTLGGPVEIPHLYNGRNRTFFFLSYEGLRLDVPQAANVTYVPDITLRATAPTPLKQVLNAYPVPNGASLGNGLAEFIGSWSSPGSIDSTSIRLDQVVNDKLRLFFRFANTSSSLSNQGAGIFGVASVLNATEFTTRTYTLGTTSALSPSISNEFRLGYSSNTGTFSATLISFGGATPVNLNQLQGFPAGSSSSPSVQIGLFLGTGFPIMSPHTSSGEQRQWNIVDALTWSRGRHQIKMGFDFRRLDPRIFSANPVATYDYLNANAVQTNSVSLGAGQSFAAAYPVYINFSSFVQDEWKITPRLTLSGGLRWEINPAPGAANGNPPYTVTGSSLSTLALAPRGTPLWKTGWFNFAPRLGVAYVVRGKPGFETVARVGGGVFFDTGQQLGSYGYQGPGFSAMTPLFGSLFGSPASFPLPPAQVSPPIVNPPKAPFTNSTVFAFPAHLQLPYTIQWNATIQQALGRSEAFTVSYVGSHAARLLEESQVNVHPFNPAFGYIYFLRNGLTADYNALQLQFQRRLSRGLQALASYTWAHSIDYGSYNFVVPYQRGNSDFDVRHSFTSAFVYDFPQPFKNGFARAVLHHWGLDDRFTARTGYPVSLQGGLTFDPATGESYYSGLNLVPGQPLYIHGSACAPFNNGLGCPGGQAINPRAFSLPAGCTPSTCPPGTAVGDAPRNSVRGLGAWQMDLAVRREFPIHERLKLQFRAEAFNVFNHPNFGMINATYCSAGPGCTFGQATATLANSLGGLSPLYQLGGPRSWQFALKLIF